MTPVKSIHRILALATLAATAFLSQTMHAQANIHASRVTVPFAFSGGGKTYAPGVYTIKMISGDFLSVSNASDSGFIMVQGNTEVGPSSQGYLLFRKYGHRYFLGEYHPANSLSSANIVQSKSERRTAREFAANKADQGRIRLALLGEGSVSSGR